MKVNIETERFILREIRITDLEGMFLLDSDPEVNKYLGNKPVQTKEEEIKIIEFIHKQYEEYGLGRLAIIEKSSDEFVGWTGIKYETEVRSEFNYYDLGYRLRKEYWGKGIGTETAIASLRFGFLELKLDEIFGAADIANIGSNKILKKVGLNWIETFPFEGVEHNWYGIKRENWNIKN